MISNRGYPARLPSRVVMIGTDPATHGGIAAALGVWLDAGLFARWPITYIATHRDGTRLEKLLRAIDAAAVFIGLLCCIRCAILHVHGASRASFWRKAPFMALALLARWPVIFHLHGGGFADFYARECGPVRRAVVRFFLERAARVVVVSERWEAWMRGIVSHDRVTCIPNAVPLARAGSRRRIPGRIAFVGRLTAEKGVFEALEAFALLRAGHPEARLALAGEGDVDAVTERARELGIADRVLVRGYCAPAVRERMLASASVFVLPSHVEALPMSLLEAMAAGCPVVASRVGGVPDVVRDGVNGVLVTAGDALALGAAIRRLLDNEKHAEALGRAARVTIARHYAPVDAIERIGAIYSNLGQLPYFRPLPPLSRHPACA